MIVYFLFRERVDFRAYIHAKQKSYFKQPPCCDRHPDYRASRNPTQTPSHPESRLFPNIEFGTRSHGNKNRNCHIEIFQHVLNDIKCRLQGNQGFNSLKITATDSKTAADSSVSQFYCALELEGVQLFGLVDSPPLDSRVPVDSRVL